MLLIEIYYDIKNKKSIFILVLSMLLVQIKNHFYCVGKYSTSIVINFNIIKKLNFRMWACSCPRSPSLTSQSLTSTVNLRRSGP